MFGSTAGTLALKVTADTSTLQRTIAADASKAGAVGGASLGKKLIGGLAAVGAGAAVLGFTKSVISEASDLNESINAVNVTFGKSAEGIKTLGREAATSLGLSNNEFNSLAVRFSSFAKTISGPGGNVVGVMDEMTTRAADFASVMNLDVNEAAQVFQSGLAGETEPLKRFGIDLSAAAVEAYALKEGIASSAASMTESQKVQARYGLLMQQTKKTQGDFANTSDGLANSQRILGATWDNVKAKLGAGLLPVLASFVTFVGQKVVPGIADLWKSFTESDVYSNIVSTFGAIKGAVMGFLDVAVPAVQSFVEALRENGDILPSIATAVGVVVTALVAYKAIMGAIAIVQAIVAATNPFTLIALAVVAVVAAVVYAYRRFDWFRTLIQTVWKVIQVGVKAVVMYVKVWWAVLTTVFKAAWKIVSTVVKVAWTVIRKYVVTYLKIITVVIKVAWRVVSTVFRTAWRLIAGVIRTAWGIIKGIVQAGVRVVISIINGIRAVVGFVANIFSNVVSTIRSWIDRAVDVVTGLKDRVVNFFSGAKDWLVDIGRDMIQGLIDGAGELLSKIGEFLLDKLPGWIVTPFKKALGIASPSKLFYGFGENLGEGFALGIEAKAGRVQSATDSIQPKVPAMGRAHVAPMLPAGGLTPAGWDGAEVRVYIGDRELTDIVRVETRRETALQGAAYRYRRR